MTPPATSRAGGGRSTKPRRPVATGSGGMRERAGALVCLSMAVQSRAFLVAPAVGGGACRPRAGAGAARTSAASLLMAYDVKYSPNKWWDEDDIVPGFGGIWPGDPDAETHHVTYVNKAGEEVASADVPVDRYIYFATEDAGVDVPIINKKRMCRNGCCTTCAVKVLEGKVKQEGALGLLKDLKQEGYALTCCSYPKSDLVVRLQEEDDVYMKQFGNDFEGGGVEWGGVFLDED
ncbi:unnamed protein product [Ectocarpus sp. 8 AP-2014]